MAVLCCVHLLYRNGGTFNFSMIESGELKAKGSETISFSERMQSNLELLRLLMFLRIRVCFARLLFKSVSLLFEK